MNSCEKQTPIYHYLDISNDGPLYYFIPWKVKFYWKSHMTFHWRIWTWIPLQPVDSVDPDKSYRHVQPNKCSLALHPSCPWRKIWKFMTIDMDLQSCRGWTSKFHKIPGSLFSKSNSAQTSPFSDSNEMRVIMDPKHGLKNHHAGNILIQLKTSPLGLFGAKNMKL